jgi:predicted nucleic acid-binding protein
VILYADTSALFKLLVNEAGSEVIVTALQSADAVASAAIAYVELRAALAAAIRDGRIPGTARDLALAELERLWGGVSPVAIRSPLLQLAGDLAERYRLRGYDAVHLAALLDLGSPGEVSLCCWDTDLRRAAGAIGYTLVPASS